MTQRDPDPAELPEAVPVLSYQLQTDDGMAQWIVRFVGAWVIATAAASLLVYGGQMAMDAWSGTLRLYSMYGLPVILGEAASIIFGIAIVRQQRYGFYGKMVVLMAKPAVRLIGLLPSNPFAILFSSTAPEFVQAAVTLAMLLSVLRRADAKGVLQPVRAGRTGSQHEDCSLAFLISRMGWVYLAHGGMVLVYLAIMPLLRRGGASVVPWSWHSNVQLGLYLAVGVCGLLLCWRKAWAIWLLVVIMPLQGVGVQLLAMWQFSIASGQPLSLRTAVFAPAVNTAAHVLMLCVLGRKAAQAKA